MYYSKGFVCGGYPEAPIKIESVKPLGDMMMLVSFNNGETRLFDASCLQGEVFEPLKEEAVFRNCIIEYGVPTWSEGSIDCAPEYIYDHSFEYGSDLHDRQSANA